MGWMVTDLVDPRTLFEIEDDKSTSAVAVGDVTGTMRPELCTGGRDGVIKLYDANESEIRLLAQHDILGSVLSIKIADANNDGQNEVVIGRSIGPGDTPGQTGTLQIYRYAPSGCLEILAEHPIDRFVTTVVVTDVTGDNRNEILAGGSDSTLRVFKLDTNDNLTEFARFDLEDMPITIGTCDVIGDEIDEIVTGNRDKTLRIFKVRDHSIDQIDVLNLPSPVISVSAGDILGDRKMEMGVVTHDGSIRIYRNEESKLDLFSTLEDVKALSIRMEELNADHMDEIVIATSDHKVLFYSLYMAELQKLAEVDIGAKILSLAVGDAGGDDRNEILVGVSDRPLKVIEGLYQIIPDFSVQQNAEIGTELTGKLRVVNVTDRPISGISGKIYHFPKDAMTVEPQQIQFELGPHENATREITLKPVSEGSVIVRPIVLMWKDNEDQIKQVTTPETVIMVEKGSAAAASTEAPSTAAVEPEPTSAKETVYEEPSPFAPVKGTGFTSVSDEQRKELAAAVSGDEKDASIREAEALLDQLFGETPAQPDVSEIDKIQSAVSAEAEPGTTVVEPEVSEVEPGPDESALVAQIRSRKPKPPRPGTQSDAYSYLFKTMITGEGAVGKTTLVNRYVTGVFERDYKTTIGSQFAVKLTHIFPPESEYAVGIKVQAWDVAGQARFAAVRKMYYSGAAGVILVYDVTRRRSFTELPKWVQEADESIGTRAPILVVGNKVDLPDRTVSAEEAKKWAEDQGFLYMESSAKTGEGVADMFSVLSEVMWRQARESTEKKKDKS
ncbi:GTP-binding protein [Candidatus Thorarchaeota archaeon]|nr:MAG: GTP-binding protein [Candidatus Thorarchaeota archaeon]